MPLSAFSKDKLVFDPTVADQGDNVGAFLRDAAGNLITTTPTSLYANYDGTPAGATTPINITANVSGPGGNITLTGDGTSTVAQLIAAWNLANPTNTVTLTAGDGSQIPTNATPITLGGGADKNPIDVNIVSGSIDVSVKLNGIYAVDNPKPDNVGIVLFDRQTTPGLADEKFTPTGGKPTSDSIVPTTVWAQDVNSFLMGYNSVSGDWDRLHVDTSGNLNVNIANSSGSGAVQVAGNIADDDPDASSKPVKVGSRSEWGALAAISANGDRADLVSDKYRRIYVNNGSNIALLQSQKNASTAGAVAAPTTALAGRRNIIVQNLSNKEVYIGSSSVASNDGLVLAARASISLDVGQDVPVYVLGSAATNQDIRILEMA